MRADQKTLGRSRSAGWEEKLVNLSIDSGEYRRQGRGYNRVRGWNPIPPPIFLDTSSTVHITLYTKGRYQYSRMQ